MKVRIIEKYSPYSGTWYVIQLRLFWIWWTMPKVYTDSVTAEHALYDFAIMVDRKIDMRIVIKKDLEYE